MKPIEMPQGHLSPRQFDTVMSQFDSTQPMKGPATGARVSHEGTQRGRVGRVTAQHKGGENVNVEWRRGDVSVEPVAGLRESSDPGPLPKTKKRYLKGL